MSFFLLKNLLFLVIQICQKLKGNSSSHVRMLLKGFHLRVAHVAGQYLLLKEVFCVCASMVLFEDNFPEGFCIWTLKEYVGRGLNGLITETTHWVHMYTNMVKEGPSGKPFIIKEPYEGFDLIGGLQFPDSQVVVACICSLRGGSVGKKRVG